MVTSVGKGPFPLLFWKGYCPLTEMQLTWGGGVICKEVLTVMRLCFKLRPYCTDDFKKCRVKAPVKVQS